MSGAVKEIRTKIKSVQNTRKITSAMEMVAASKVRRAQERMAASRPYALEIRRVIGHLANAHPEYRHAYLETRPVKRTGLIVVTTDRGLCGGLNANLLKITAQELFACEQQNVPVDLCLIGSKGQVFFKRFGGNVVAQASQLGDQPTVVDLIGVVKVMLDAYQAGTIDRLAIVSNQFVNTMTQKPVVQQLLPLVKRDGKSQEHYWDYLYEPEAKQLLDELLRRYIESQVYQAVIENIACEQAARRIAMKNASDNAGDLINQLQLVYNKARQAAITQELSEIVAGAAAVE